MIYKYFPINNQFPMEMIVHNIAWFNSDRTLLIFIDNHIFLLGALLIILYQSLLKNQKIYYDFFVNPKNIFEYCPIINILCTFR